MLSTWDLRVNDLQHRIGEAVNALVKVPSLLGFYIRITYYNYSTLFNNKVTTHQMLHAV
jgi:hypothetical protein